ncbi:hypothetical protein JY96_08685 [Aquabacterium sp. NJ1]|uniref:PAS domain S-box protein n=1 Tax=Aquabacterium sp. NJ1 TaxID=1538295 RepID=UPI00052DF4B2|nr:PAS domain S-box protein [Aquabacterium sp. NJ1]KGM40083.1 hypothetical protein JY96_08685 [Aquabacterium sp. NJ1]
MVKTSRLGLVALNVMMTVFCATTLWRSWQADMAAGKTQALTTARLLEQGATASFDKIAVVLSGVADRLEHEATEGAQESGTNLWQTVDQAISRIPDVQQIEVFDANGQQLCGQPMQRCMHLDISAQDYFQRLLKQPDERVGFYGTYTSLADGQPCVIMARALFRAPHAFNGVIIAVIPVSRLSSLIAKASLGQHGIAALRSSTLNLVVRYPAAPPSASLANQLTTELTRVIQSAPNEGVYRSTSQLDGVERVIAYRRMPDLALYVMVGNALDDFMADWWWHLAWMIAFLLTFFTASWSLSRRTLRRARQYERTQRLYNTAPCGYHTLDPHGRYLSINDTELTWLGCPRDEVIARLSPTDFMTEESRQTFAQNFPAFKQKGELNGLELELVSRQGVVRRVLVSAKAVQDKQGQFTMSNSVMHDITPLHQARQALREQARQQALMLNTDLIGIMRLVQRKTVWANQGMTRIFGYPGEAWQGMPVRQLHADEASYAHVGEEAYAAFRQGRPYRTQLQMRRMDGSLVWIDVSAARLSDTTEEVMLLLADITPLKEAEQARLKAVELEAQNQQLRALSRLKDDFLANMSHELRTPLNAIMGFTQLLQMQRYAPDSALYGSALHQIESGGQRLLDLVESMLAFGQVEAGKMPFSPAMIDVQAALDDICDTVRPQAQQHQIELHTAIDPTMSKVEVDPLRLRQMGVALASNAIKFSRPGSLVWVRAGYLGELEWFLEVEDQGAGIAASDLSRLFTPFVQLSSGMSRTHEGAGLGLALVRHMARAQGGEVYLLTQEGVGSIFRIVLPRQAPVPADAWASANI